MNKHAHFLDHPSVEEDAVEGPAGIDPDRFHTVMPVQLVQRLTHIDPVHPCNDGVDPPVFAGGGINYHWYGLDGLCNREPFGIVANYHLADSNGPVRTQVQQQLAVMRSRGMQRLSLGIYFTHGFSSGTLIDSSEPAQIEQAVTNIGNLLADVKAAGYF